MVYSLEKAYLSRNIYTLFTIFRFFVKLFFCFYCVGQSSKQQSFAWLRSGLLLKITLSDALAIAYKLQMFKFRKCM